MPNIIIPGYEYNALNGKSAVLVQIEEGMLFSLSVQWEKYEEENQQWFSVENNSRSLAEDDGKYIIICKTAYHEVKSSPIALTVNVPVKINKLETGPVTVREGDKVEIRCLVDGRSEPKVTWRLANGTTIIASNLRNVQENVLILENVTKLNEGNYTCIAHNNFSRDEFLVYLTVSDIPVFNPPNKNLTVSLLEKHVVPGTSVFVCVALIAVIVVVILIRRKRQKGRTGNTTNGQKQPSSSEKISCGNNHAKFYVHISGDVTYAQVIRKSSNHIVGNKSIRDANIPQSETHTDGSKSIGDPDASHVYMNINNAYADVQQRSSTISSSTCINETESENTQVNKTKQLNYVELEFNSLALDESSSLGIRGSSSDTTYTEVVFTL
ncbi:hypothetical protein ACJMK2_026643 [Sinanodonta woodiana]|uniref:Ig-like domain-containing protein n=1 Tax=Sinanodonta woodiana TaxID=1069815 RepID=A0ABD3XNX7_SINWO